jgi:type II secretory pathway pseudopilin PulG
MYKFSHLHQNKKGFTIFELSIGITIFASLMIAILASVSYISVARQKSENRILLLQELYFFSEQLIGVVTDGGTLDYEEYWNRMTYDTETQSGHYKLPT